MARLGLMRSIQAKASSRLKWLGCGVLRSASTIQTSSPARAAMLSGGRLLDVGRVRQIAEAEAERRDIAVLLQHRQDRNRASLPLDGQRMTRRQPVLLGDRRIVAAWWRHEAIAEAGVHGARRRLVHVDVDAAALADENRAQIVHAVGMVGVLVGDEHAVEPGHLGLKQLLAQVRRTVDQHARVVALGVAALDQQAAAPPAVLRIVGVAVAPAERHARHAHGRPAAEDGEAQTHAASPFYACA